MVQIQSLGRDKMSESLLPVGATGDSLLPSVVKLPVASPIRKKKTWTTSNRSSIVLLVLSIIFAILTVKMICDLKEENLLLMRKLAFERQKDTALKLAVRNNIPSSKFLSAEYTRAEISLVEQEGRVVATPGSRWTINLAVLWQSPEITPCDMSALSRQLAKEIYREGLETRERIIAEEETRRKLVEADEDIQNEDLIEAAEEMLGELESAEETMNKIEAEGEILEENDEDELFPSYSEEEVANYPENYVDDKDDWKDTDQYDEDTENDEGTAYWEDAEYEDGTKNEEGTESYDYLWHTEDWYDADSPEEEGKEGDSAEYYYPM